jgi:hypothetical protein
MCSVRQASLRARQVRTANRGPGDHAVEAQSLNRGSDLLGGAVQLFRQEHKGSVEGRPDTFALRATSGVPTRPLPIEMHQIVTERSNAATEERLKSGHAVGGLSIV